MKKVIKAPKRGIFIEQLKYMPFDRNGMHATGRRVYAYNSLVGFMFGWNEFESPDGEKVYAN